MKTIFFLLTLQTCFAAYFTEPSQFVNQRFFKSKRGGVFVEIGAFNGIAFSNTWFFEKEFGWRGICFEPIPELFAELRVNRRCLCIQGFPFFAEGPAELLFVWSPLAKREILSGIWNGLHPFGETWRIIGTTCYSLNKILRGQEFWHIDFLSICTEWGAFEILSSLDFSSFSVDVISIIDTFNNPHLLPFLAQKGFRRVRKLGCDLLFVHSRLI